MLVFDLGLFGWLDKSWTRAVAGKTIVLAKNHVLPSRERNSSGKTATAKELMTLSADPSGDYL